MKPVGQLLAVTALTGVLAALQLPLYIWAAPLLIWGVYVWWQGEMEATRKDEDLKIWTPKDEDGA